MEWGGLGRSPRAASPQAVALPLRATPSRVRSGVLGQRRGLTPRDMTGEGAPTLPSGSRWLATTNLCFAQELVPRVPFSG